MSAQRWKLTLPSSFQLKGSTLKLCVPAPPRFFHHRGHALTPGFKSSVTMKLGLLIALISTVLIRISQCKIEAKTESQSKLINFFISVPAQLSINLKNSLISLNGLQQVPKKYLNLRRWHWRQKQLTTLQAMELRAMQLRRIHREPVAARTDQTSALWPP